MRKVIATVVISAATGLLAGGAGWMIHSTVDSSSARALFTEKLAEHDRQLVRHDRALDEIPTLKVLMAEVSANQRALAAIVARMERRAEREQ